MAEDSIGLVSLVPNKLNTSSKTDLEAVENIESEENIEKAMTPMLICESTVDAVPPNLISIIKSLNYSGGSETDPTDLFVCVLYVIMIETGFIPMQFEDQCHYDDINFNYKRLLEMNQLPPYWKYIEANIYKFDFIIPMVPSRVCKMTCLYASEVFTINVMVNATKLCIQLNPCTYVPLEEIEPTHKKFRCLNDLSMRFKDRIANPAKNLILSAENMFHPSLQELPFEVLYKIASELPISDYSHLLQTCWRLNEIQKIYGFKIWELFFRRDFQSQQRPVETVTWEMRYKQALGRRKKLRNLCHISDFFRNLL